MWRGKGHWNFVPGDQRERTVEGLTGAFFIESHLMPVRHVRLIVREEDGGRVRGCHGVVPVGYWWCVCPESCEL